jgi:hypothetical protein
MISYFSKGSSVWRGSVVGIDHKLKGWLLQLTEYIDIKNARHGQL